MRAAWLLALVACGGSGPQLTNLRCRDASACQDTEDPLKVKLAVDFNDSTATLSRGTLTFALDGNAQSSVSLSTLFAAQGLAPDAKTGTLQLDDDLVLDRITQGQAVSVSVSAVDGAGEGSNSPSVAFTLNLAGGP